MTREEYLLGCDLLGADTYYSLAEIKKLLDGVKTDVAALQRDMLAQQNKISLGLMRDFDAWQKEVSVYLSGLGFSGVISDLGYKQEGDKLIEYREQVAAFRKRFEGEGGVVRNPPPARPSQMRDNDPREGWGWKEWLAATVFGVAAIGGVAYVGGHYVMGKARMF